MRCLTRYVVAEFLKIFMLTLGAMTLFMLVVLVAQEAMQEGLGFGPLLRLIPYGLPEALLYAVPATTLMTVCSMFGRMSADNELLAIKSAGIAPSAMIIPSLALAALVSVVAVWLNDLAFSWGEPGMRRVIVESVEQIAYRMLRARGSYSHEHFSIHVARVDGRRLIRPTLVFSPGGGSHETVLTAREAELSRHPQDEALVIRLMDYMVQRGDIVYAQDGPDWCVVPLLDDGKSLTEPSSPSHLPLRQVARELSKQRATLVRRRQTLARLAAYEMLTGQFDELTGNEWDRHHDQMQADRRRLKTLESVPWRRWANGFSCFFFAMVGVPLAIRLRNANLFSTFAACFLPILVVYYPLLAYGVESAKRGDLPPYAVWLGNAICCVVGGILLRQAQRH